MEMSGVLVVARFAALTRGKGALAGAPHLSNQDYLYPHSLTQARNVEKCENRNKVSLFSKKLSVVARYI